MHKTLGLAASLMLAGVAAGCHRPAPDAMPGNDATAADLSPEGALGNQIVVDPARLARRDTPRQVPARAVRDGTCDFPYDMAWATRLPAELAVYPGAKVTEAAGSDASGCRRRIVSFTVAVPPARVIDHYRTVLTAAGYTAEHLSEEGRDVLGGTRGDAAYYITTGPIPGGAAVDLVANGG